MAAGAARELVCALRILEHHMTVSERSLAQYEGVVDDCCGRAVADPRDAVYSMLYRNLRDVNAAREWESGCGRERVSSNMSVPPSPLSPTNRGDLSGPTAPTVSGRLGASGSRGSGGVLGNGLNGTGGNVGGLTGMGRVHQGSGRPLPARQTLHGDRAESDRSVIPAAPWDVMHPKEVDSAVERMLGSMQKLIKETLNEEQQAETTLWRLDAFLRVERAGRRMHANVDSAAWTHDPSAVRAPDMLWTKWKGQIGSDSTCDATRGLCVVKPAPGGRGFVLESAAARGQSGVFPGGSSDAADVWPLATLNQPVSVPMSRPVNNCVSMPFPVVADRHDVRRIWAGTVLLFRPHLMDCSLRMSCNRCPKREPWLWQLCAVLDAMKRHVLPFPRWCCVMLRRVHCCMDVGSYTLWTSILVFKGGVLIFRTR